MARKPTCEEMTRRLKFLEGESQRLKRAEEALRDSEEKFRAVAQSAVDAIISVDGMGNIVFWNKAAKKMFGFSKEEVLGQPLELVIPERFRMDHQRGIKRIRSTGKSHLIGKTVELQGLRKNRSEFPLELSLAKWKTKNDVFFTGIVRDITNRRRIEEERDQLIAKLQEALAKVKTLSGLLPICSNCKKIRDDKGYWSFIENYIHDHSDAEFTHSICPECVKKLYPDLNLSHLGNEESGGLNL